MLSLRQSMPVALPFYWRLAEIHCRYFGLPLGQSR